MKQRAQRHWFGISCLLVASCTQLQDPNQIFGGVDRGGASSSAAGNAGQAGISGAGSAGVLDDSAGAGPNSGGSPHAGSSSAGKGGLAGTGGDAGAPDTDCEDETGFNGLGCYSCAPKDIFTLENACSDAACTPFDSKRLTLLGADGKLPPLPPIGAGGAAGASSSGGAGGTAGATSTGKACADVAKAGGTLVYITGSSAAQPFLQQIAQQLVAPADPTQRVYVVYESTGSCIGVDAVVNGTPMTSGAAPAPALSATYWDSLSSTGVACDLPAAGVAADIGASDVFAQSCPGFETAILDMKQVRDSHGPIQTMTFAVPANSDYSEISAEAAYFVFGFGASGGVKDASGSLTLWNNEDYLFKRSATSGTQAMLAAAIGVPGAVWKGKGHKGSGDVATSLQLANQKKDTANLALGILAADYIESKNLSPSTVKVLAFQDTAQHCAVYPSSTAGARDKINVRDGHYPVWSPLHLLVRVDSAGNPYNPANRQAVTDILGYLSGTKALPNGSPLISVYAGSGLVPECAMHVQRTKDGGDITPYKPSNPCSCLFDSLVGSTGCKKCTVQGNCKTGEICSQGYCEAQ